MCMGHDEIIPGTRSTCHVSDISWVINTRMVTYLLLINTRYQNGDLQVPCCGDNCRHVVNDAAKSLLDVASEEYRAGSSELAEAT